MDCRIFNNHIAPLTFLLLIIFNAQPCAAEPDKPSAPIAYHLEIELHPAEQSISATATIMLPRAKPATLRLAAQADIARVEIDGAPAAFSFQGGTLAIETPPAAGEDPLRLTVRYRARFADRLPADTTGIEDPSFGVGAVILPEGAYLSAATPWFPQVAGQRGRHHLRISAPAGTVAVTAGRLVETVTRDKRTTTVWENRFPLEGLALSAGQYVVNRDTLDDIQLLTFLTPENAALAPGYLAAMRRHLAFYRDLLGPYPFTKFAVVENFLPTGYGMPSWTLLGKSVVRLPFLFDTSLPHEIVHSWWGNAVEVDDAGGNWAEGLTTYLADYLLKERDNPAEALDYRRKLLRDYASLVTPQNDFPLNAFTGRMAKYQQAIGYGKGAMVFHMLRQEVGDQIFRAALRSMALTRAGQSLGWNGIERTFSAAAGRDLHWFFAQWTEQKGAPELALDEVKAERSVGGWVVTGLIRQNEDSYRLSLPLKLTMSNGETATQTIALANSRTPFRFATAAAPSLLGADPDSNLFRRLSPIEMPATINDLLTPQRPLIVIAAGQQPLFEAAGTLLKGLHWESAEVVSESALSPASLAGRDLLLIGWPRQAELRPALPDGLAIASNDGTVSWTVVNEPSASDTLFVVLVGQDRRDGLRAILLAKDPDAAQQVTPKIPHYGRYSLLLFAAGRNTAKTTWAPQASPLRVVFRKELQP